MINFFFISKVKFSMLFVILLLTDIYVKVYYNDINYRYLSKPLILISLIAYYYFNQKHKNEKVENNVLLALGFFLLGGFMILNYENTCFLMLSMLFFAIGKVFFCIKFSNKEDFEFSRLFPFVIIIYVFITFIISIVYENLQGFLIPCLISLCISLVMLNLAYLRKEEFSKLSYLYVLLGSILFVLVESINAINTFNKTLPFPTFLIMLFYGISMYFIVFGIVSERKKEVVNDINNT